MCENPYEYENPVDLSKNNFVGVSRKEVLTLIIQGVRRGEYWAILGPRQIGKTTFLHQIKNNFPNTHILYFDFKTSPSNEEALYQRIIDRFLEKIPSMQPKIVEERERSYDPVLRFFNFLKKFKPREDKKILLLFDEIALSLIRSFLRTWRMVYQVGFKKNQKNLKRYVVIITGSVDLKEIDIGPNSAFNISQTLALKDFSHEESKCLIDVPFKKYNIRIDPKAKKKLLSQISGHPQLLQHACHILFETAKASKTNNPLTLRHVDDAIAQLLLGNSSLKMLRRDINNDEGLRALVKTILNGTPPLFLPNSQYATLGAGAIKEVDSYCEIRNEIYKKFLHKILDKREKSSFLKHFKMALNVSVALIALGGGILAITSKLPLFSKIVVIVLVICIFILVFFKSQKEEKEKKDQ
jgi:hypothetical protein